MSPFEDKNHGFTALLKYTGLGALMGLLFVSFVMAADKSDPRGLIFPSEIENQIQKILNNPKQVYKTDSTKEKATNDRIDKFFSYYLNFQKATHVTRKKDESTVFKIPIAVSQSIRWDSKQKEDKRYKVKMRGSVWYTKSPQKRSFLKESDIPSKKLFKDDQAITIAQAFMTENKFISVTGADKLMPAAVLVRKKQEIKTDGKIGQVINLSQRISFMRQIDGLPVLNAKQTVDLHPDRNEIIGYKKIRWSETLSGGQSLPYRTKDEIMSEMQTLLSKPGTNYTIQQITPAMYQLSDRIVPILAVKTTKRIKNEKIQPIQETFLIGLVKGFDNKPPNRPTIKRRPERAKKR
ncbi:hypothetical protein ACFL36_05665 [Thermodesulfobacteriota bacterium]